MKSGFNPDIDLITFQPAQFLAFRDMEVCKRVAKVRKEDLCALPTGTHPQFRARIAPVKDFHFQMALDMLVRIKRALDEGRQFVGVFPTGPIFQYQMLADMVNALRIPLHHMHYFSMDEYADENGNDIDPNWPGSFHYTIEKQFLARLDPALRIPATQVHYPSKKNVDHYDEMILEARRDPSAKGAEIVYGGTGLSGHYSFWDPHLAKEYGMSGEQWRKATPRLISFHPVSTVQMAVTDMSGAWAVRAAQGLHDGLHDDDERRLPLLVERRLRPHGRRLLRGGHRVAEVHHPPRPARSRGARDSLLAAARGTGRLRGDRPRGGRPEDRAHRVADMDLRERVDGWIGAHREEVLECISSLIRIPTENLPPGGNEKPGQEFLRETAARFVPAADLDMFEVDDVPGVREHPCFFPTIDGTERLYAGRPILVARRRGRGGGRSLAFSGHMDTMPVYGKTWTVFPDPFSGEIRDGRLYGRGAIDMKAGTAAGFLALRCLHDLGVELAGDVYAESVVDEENGGANGTLAARLRNPSIDFAMLAEPSDLAVGVETIGGSDWKASVTEAGPGGIGPGTLLANPIYTLSRIALALEKYDRALAAIPAPPVYDPSMRVRLLTYQLASGGHGYADSGAVPTSGHLFFWQETWADTCEAEARRELLAFIEEELAAGGGPSGAAPSIETVIRFLEGHRTDRAHPALASIGRAYAALGLPHAEKGIPFATDAFVFRKASRTDVAVVGPVGANPHGVDEWVDIESIFALIRVMVLTAADFCG